MARRRYISTEISVDDRVTELAESNLLVPLLYTWMILHAEDDATLRGTPRQIKLKVLPGVPVGSDQIEEALAAMASAGLIEWDREFEVVGFPPTAFYRYQTYVPKRKRRTAPLAEHLRQSVEPPTSSAHQRETPQNADEQRRTAETSTIPSPSPSPIDTNMCIEAVPNQSTDEESNDMDADAADPVRQVMDCYNDVFRDLWSRPLRLTQDRKAKIQARLKTYDVDRICQAIRNIRQSEFHCGENEHGRVYADPEFICRNDAMIDKWANRKVIRAVPVGGAREPPEKGRPVGDDDEPSPVPGYDATRKYLQAKMSG